MAKNSSGHQLQRRHFAIAGLHFAWNGAHTVNVFDGEREVDVFSVGDFALASATEAEVIAGINDYVADWPDSGELALDLSTLSDEALGWRIQIAHDQAAAWWHAMFELAPSEYECDRREENWFWWSPRRFYAAIERNTRRRAGGEAREVA